jgi:hypothetical protein
VRYVYVEAVEEALVILPSASLFLPRRSELQLTPDHLREIRLEDYGARSRPPRAM